MYGTNVRLILKIICAQLYFYYTAIYLLPSLLKQTYAVLDSELVRSWGKLYVRLISKILEVQL